MWILFCTFCDQVLNRIKEWNGPWINTGDFYHPFTRTRPLWFKLNFLSSFSKALDQMASDVLERFLPLILMPDFSTGHSSEKLHNLFRDYSPEKTSSRPWFETAGWARSHFRYSECAKLFLKYLGFNTAPEASHQKPSPLTLKCVCTAEKFFWFWCPYTNCQHTVSFFTALWCTWRGFLPWTRSHNSKCA